MTAKTGMGRVKKAPNALPMLYLNTVGRDLKRSHLMYGSLTKQKVAELSSNCWPPDKRRIRVTKYKKPNSKHLLLVYCCCRHLNVYSKSVKLISHIFPTGQVTSNNMVHKKKAQPSPVFHGLPCGVILFAVGVGANIGKKGGHTTWKFLENCARNWYIFVYHFVLRSPRPVEMMCIIFVLSLQF